MKNLIESGILEAYVLGQTTPEETITVKAAIETDAEVAAAVRQLEADLEQYALAHQKTPPASLKSKIKGEIFKESSPFTMRSKNWPMAAVWFALGLSFLGNFLLFSSWQKSEKRLSELKDEKQLLAQNTKVFIAKYEEKIAMIENQNSTKLVLSGIKSPDFHVYVYLDKDKSELVFGEMKMPSLQANQQFQLWAIVNGKPVDAGLIEPDSVLEKRKIIKGASAYAISLEKLGGSTTEKGPLGEVVVLGEV